MGEPCRWPPLAHLGRGGRLAGRPAPPCRTRQGGEQTTTLRPQKGVRLRDDAFAFTPDRRLDEQLRPLYGRQEGLFVPNTSHGLAGYVTFNSAAQRLSRAVEQVGLPSYVARSFQGGTVLWLLDATPERAAQALHTVGDCFLSCAYQEGPWDARHLPEEDLLLPEDPWPYGCGQHRDPLTPGRQRRSPSSALRGTSGISPSRTACRKPRRW